MTVRVSSASFRNPGPVRQIAVHLLTDLNPAHLNPSPLLVTCAGLLKGGMRISEIGSQIGIQAGLIHFDGEQSGSPQGIHSEEEVLLGRPRIGRADPSRQG